MIGMGSLEMLDAADIVTGYGRAEIVHGISLSAAPGEVVCIVGPNGAGKSTFIKALAGSLRIHSGRLVLAGTDVTRLTQDLRSRRGLGYLPQTRDVFPSLTVSENLAMGGYMCRRSELPGRREEILGRFPQLKIVLRSRAGSLSGGERKLLGLARILMGMPSVLLLDEPTSGLAPQHAEIVRTYVHQLAQDGHCVVVVEQHVVEALEMSDRAFVLVSGRIQYQGRARELLDNENLGHMFLGRR